MLPRPMVILFGAGATRAAFENRPPPPLDTDFFEIAGQLSDRGTEKLAQRVAKNVYDIYQHVTGVGLEEFYRDIETRLVLSGFARTANRPKDWEKQKTDLEELIRRVIIHTTCELKSGQTATPIRSSIHERILSKLQPKDTIVTFNYDTVIEESMPDGSPLWTPNGGYGVPVSGSTHEWTKHWRKYRHVDENQKSKVKLLKLHGSINWTLYKNSKIRLKHRPYVMRTKKKGQPKSETIAFLPPGWRKKVDQNPYNSLWAKARLAMEQCKSLVIIGYSLPETDLIAKALFLEINRKRRSRNNFLKELHIADTSEITKKRLIELFYPALGAHGSVFRYDSASNLADIWSPLKRKRA